MSTIHEYALAPEQLVPCSAARQARRRRNQERIQDAVFARPALRIDRVEPVLEVLRAYRHGRPESSPMRALLQIVEAELGPLEAEAQARSSSEQREGATIRTALLFLRAFSRISVLDFDDIPIEERPMLVRLLRLEYRWCFAAAGTTQESFRRAIGRTGAR